MDSIVWSEGMRKLISHLIIIPCEVFEKPHPLVSHKDFKHLDCCCILTVFVGSLLLNSHVIFLVRLEEEMIGLTQEF